LHTYKNEGTYKVAPVLATKTYGQHTYGST